MAFTLPKLPYAYDALEPHIDAKTMEIHHTKHHATYTEKLNAALASQPDLNNKSAEELLKNLADLPADIQTPVRNHGGGYVNHNLFWHIMSPESGGKPPSGLAKAINKNFDSYKNFQEQFSQAATQVFGSGWAWLVKDSQNALKIITTPNQDSPISQGLVPLIGLDVWEHAYYLKYQNKRPDYITAWWNVVNWEEVDKRYKAAIM